MIRSRRHERLFGLWVHDRRIFSNIRTGRFDVQKSCRISIIPQGRHWNIVYLLTIWNWNTSSSSYFSECAENIFQCAAAVMTSCKSVVAANSQRRLGERDFELAYYTTIDVLNMMLSTLIGIRCLDSTCLPFSHLTLSRILAVHFAVFI